MKSKNFTETLYLHSIKQLQRTTQTFLGQHCTQKSHSLSPLGAFRSHLQSLNLNFDVRRLFSTFAHGLPGAGLLLLRLTAGFALIVHGIAALRGGPPLGPAMLYMFTCSVGLLLLAGIWTPIVGVIVAIIALWHPFSQPVDPWTFLLLGTIGAALAMLGPGTWSADARLFGWKRIRIPDRQR